MSTPATGGFPKRENMFEREPARRVFAGEFREIRVQFRDGTDEKSPSYALLPTGQRCNRVFLVGSMTEKKRQGEQNMYYQARIADPTGTFFVSAGSYQPEAMQQMARIEPPAFVAVVGKPSIYETPDGMVMVSIRAESITIVDREVRDCWVLETAKATLDRLDTPASGPDSALAAEKYHIDTVTYRKMVYHALTQLKF
ncbi:MAG: nucleic acid-binding protein [Methanomicrobiales archaeon]|nr:nucleic acid-binding protein [Methanomicrobiales archaeon]